MGTKWLHIGKTNPESALLLNLPSFLFFFLLNQLKILWLTLNRLLCIELNYQFSRNGDVSIKEKNKNIAKTKILREWLMGVKNTLFSWTSTGMKCWESLVIKNKGTRKPLAYLFFVMVVLLLQNIHLFIKYWNNFFFQPQLHFTLSSLLGTCWRRAVCFFTWGDNHASLSILHRCHGKGEAKTAPPPPSLPLRAVYFSAKPVSAWQPQIRYDWPR